MLPHVIFFYCMFFCNCLFVCVRGKVSHVGRWGKWSSRCCPPCTPPQDPPPGCSLYHTETPQHVQCSSCVLALYRAAFVWGSRNLWLLTRKSYSNFIDLLFWLGTQFFLYLYKLLIVLPITRPFYFLAVLNTLTCRSWQAPCAIVQTDECLWANQLQLNITYITGIVQVGLSCHLDLCMFYCGRRPTGLS